MKQIWSRLKPYCRWMILGGTLFFLAKALKNNWEEVAAIQIDASGWTKLAIALHITLLAHIWCGWVWTWILRDLKQPVASFQFVRVYLKTNLAKYLPGNVWHFYGRILAAKTAGVSPSAATLSVLLEPLLMASAALAIALLGIKPQMLHSRLPIQGLPIFGLASVLIAIHPRFLNTAVRLVGRLKKEASGPEKRLESNSSISNTFEIKRYPIRPLLGELIFVGLRGTGFLLTLLALGPLAISQIPLLFSAFSFAWLLGLVVPGAPGGLGVFEATAMALLQHSFSPGLLISAIALYRLISILAEMAGAGLAGLYECHRAKS